MGRSRLSGNSDLRFLPSDTAIHIPVEATARTESASDFREWLEHILRHCARKDGWSVARVLSRHALPLQGTLLQGRARRSDVRAALLRRVSLSHLVVWRVARSAGRWSIADNQREIGVPASAALELILAGFVGEGLCKVSAWAPSPDIMRVTCLFIRSEGLWVGIY